LAPRRLQVLDHAALVADEDPLVLVIAHAVVGVEVGLRQDIRALHEVEALLAPDALGAAVVNSADAHRVVGAHERQQRAARLLRLPRGAPLVSQRRGASAVASSSTPANPASASASTTAGRPPPSRAGIRAAIASVPDAVHVVSTSPRYWNMR